jgi:azurin
MTFWAKPRDITANKMIGADGDDYMHFRDTNEFRVKANNVIDNFTIDDPANWSVDTWVHIGVVRNTSNLVTIYVDGVAQSDTETVDEAFDYRYIGGIEASKFRGQLDDFCIYSDELSAPEVLRNYNAGKRSHR